MKVSGVAPSIPFCNISKKKLGTTAYMLMCITSVTSRLGKAK